MNHKNRIEPKINKYLTNGRHDIYKSEAIREEYKNERKRLNNAFNINASNLIDTIFKNKK